MKLHPKEYWLVAFFLSKFGEKVEGKGTYPPVELQTNIWGVVYNTFYAILNNGEPRRTFENGLKNCRDAYDGHTDTSGRIGWRDVDGKPVQLPKIAKSVFDKYNVMNRDKIWIEIQKLILKDSNSKNSVNQVCIKKTNPDWTREELILTLDLYYSLAQGKMHKGHPDVIRISNELRALGIHKDILDPKSFRNPSSISRRLGNYKNMDVGYQGKGLANSGKLAKAVFQEFANRRTSLREEADSIRQLFLNPKNDVKKSFVDENKNQSDFYFKFHRNRETDPLLIKVIKEIVFVENKKLICVVCGFDSVAFYGEIGDDLMEIHYTKEPQILPGLESSDISDFVVVCSNCHKVLDKYYGLLNVSDLITLIRKE